MEKIAFYTLGCRANQHQTDILKSEILNPRSETVDFRSGADVYVINTCTVTADADRKSRQAIRRAMRQNPKARIIVTGCYAKLAKDPLLEQFPQIEIQEPRSLAPRPPSLSPRIRSNLMVQDGCEHFCSYCIVPHARGKFKSKPPEQVVKEAKQLAEAGAREIVLTGINLGAYQYDLSSLVPRLASLDNLTRIRLSSLEPMYLNRELIDIIAKTHKACKHLHIPLQSGDNGILASMNRNYTREDYVGLVHYILERMPDCGITTDIMVGFPGEGDEEFQSTVDLVNKARFSRMHIFAFSRREGTPAAGFPGQVAEKAKKQRSKQLLALREKYMKEFAQRYVDKEVELLVERKGEGLTSNYIRVLYPGKEEEVGTLRKVSITTVGKDSCWAG